MNMIKNNKFEKDCGIVAAYNAASWCNFNKSYSEIETVAKSCGYSPDAGIYFFQFDKLVKKLGLPAKRLLPKSRQQIESKLHAGKFFIFLYTPIGTKSGHAMTAYNDHNGRIRLINSEGNRKTWLDFVLDLSVNGAKNFVVYEIPPRNAAQKHDDL